MASDLHLLDAVSPTAALSGLSPTVGDAQVLLAPDSTASPDAGAFGKQLQDASAVLPIPGFAGRSIGPRNQDSSQKDWNGFSLPVMPIASVNQVSLPLTFSLPAGAIEVQPVPNTLADSSALTEANPTPSQPQTAQEPIVALQGQPQIELDSVAKPASVAPSASLIDSALPNQMVGDVSTQTVVTPADDVLPQSPLPNARGPVTEPRVVTEPRPLGSGLPGRLALQVQMPGATQELVKQAGPDAAINAAAPTAQTQPPAATDATTQPAVSILSAVTLPKPEEPALPSVATQQAVGTPQAPVPVAVSPQEDVPVRPPRGLFGPLATVTPKADQPEVSHPANWAPSAISSAPLNPSLAVAPSGSNQLASQPPVPSPQSKQPTAQPGSQNPQPIQTQPDTISQAAAPPVAQPVSGELAFAVKVTPQESVDPVTASADIAKQPVTTSAAQVAPIKELHRTEDNAGLADGASQHETAHETPLAAAAPVLAEKPAVPPIAAGETQTATANHTNAAEAAQMNATPEAKPTQPLKQLSIQVGQEQQRVQVQMVERGGELQVAVRTANPDLAQGLRQGISDLVGQLQQNGFHADAWRPGASAGTTPAAAEKPQTEAGPQYNQSQSQSGSQQDRQQGNQNPSRRPQWVEELETTSAGSGERIAGETYGISR